MNGQGTRRDADNNIDDIYIYSIYIGTSVAVAAAAAAAVGGERKEECAQPTRQSIDYTQNQTDHRPLSSLAFVIHGRENTPPLHVVPSFPAIAHTGLCGVAPGRPTRPISSYSILFFQTTKKKKMGEKKNDIGMYKYIYVKDNNMGIPHQINVTYKLDGTNQRLCATRLTTLIIISDLLIHQQSLMKSSTSLPHNRDPS